MPTMELDKEESTLPVITLAWHLLLGVVWAGWTTLLCTLPGLVWYKRPYPSLKWLSMAIWTIPLCLFAR